LALLFEVLELFLEGGVAAGFDKLGAGGSLSELSLEGLTQLVFKA